MDLQSIVCDNSYEKSISPISVIKENQQLENHIVVLGISISSNIYHVIEEKCQFTRLCILPVRKYCNIVSYFYISRTWDNEKWPDKSFKEYDIHSMEEIVGSALELSAKRVFFLIGQVTITKYELKLCFYTTYRK